MCDFNNYLLLFVCFLYAHRWASCVCLTLEECTATDCHGPIKAVLSGGCAAKSLFMFEGQTQANFRPVNLSGTTAFCCRCVHYHTFSTLPQWFHKHCHIAIHFLWRNCVLFILGFSSYVNIHGCWRLLKQWGMCAPTVMIVTPQCGKGSITRL